MGASSVITTPAKSATDPRRAEHEAALERIAARTATETILPNGAFASGTLDADRAAGIWPKEPSSLGRYPEIGATGAGALAQLIRDYDAAWTAHEWAAGYDDNLYPDDPRYAPAEAAWEAAQAGLTSAWRALAAYPVTTLQELGEKARAMSSARFIVHCDEATDLLFLAEDAQRLAATPDREAWEAARVAYETIRAEYDALDGTAAYSAGIVQVVPAELVEPNLNYAAHVRWYDENTLYRDPTLSRAEKDRLAPLVAKVADALGAIPSDDTDDLAETLYERVCDAEEALCSMPAPDAAAAAYKALLMAREADDEKLGFDDIGRVCFMRHHYLPDRQTVALVTDLLRLAGLDHPALHIAPFVPRDWIREVEEAGAKVAAGRDQLIIADPLEGDDVDVSGLPAWQLRAIFLAAQDRREGGGDPVFDSHGDCGDKDMRGNGPGIKQLASGVRIIFAREASEVGVRVARFDTGAELAVYHHAYRTRGRAQAEGAQ